MRGKKLAPIVACLVVSFFASSAGAWEYAYGPFQSEEQAFRRVAPVVECPTKGYIAVGTLRADTPNPDVHVVYTTLTGAPLWEGGYDIQGLGLADEGIAIVELPLAVGPGFVILSNTWVNGQRAPALTYISCHGGPPLWTFIYPSTCGQDLVGSDLIRTADGDFAVAGLAFNGNDEDAFLMRTDPNGTLIWSQTYETNGLEAFHALTEADPQCGQPKCDLVAVGRLDPGNGDLQSLVARVDGNSGLIGAAPQCMAHHGGPASQEVYNSVTRLVDQDFAGQFAMVGTVVDPGSLSDIWLTRGDPCSVDLKSRIGDPPNEPGPTAEEGYDIKEITNPALAPVGHLAIAGRHGPGFAGPFDAAFLQVTTAGLMPVPGTGWLFGDLAGKDDAFYSLAEDPATRQNPGFILAGYDTDLEPGDPRDLYLVHHQPNVRGCTRAWSPRGELSCWPPSFLTPELKPAAQTLETSTVWQALDTALMVCP